MKFICKKHGVLVSSFIINDTEIYFDIIGRPICKFCHKLVKKVEAK